MFSIPFRYIIIAASANIKIKILTKSNLRFIGLSHFASFAQNNTHKHTHGNPIVFGKLDSVPFGHALCPHNSFTVNDFNNPPKHSSKRKDSCTLKTKDQLCIVPFALNKHF